MDAVNCKRLMNDIIEYLEDEFWATKDARVHCETGGCLVQLGIDCTVKCFHRILQHRAPFVHLTEQLKTASFHEQLAKRPRSLQNKDDEEAKQGK